MSKGADRLPARDAILALVDQRPLKRGDPLPDSYVGGLPCLPPERNWPTAPALSGRPARYQWFIGQIDLSDLPSNAANYLPRAGRLLFFADIDAACDGQEGFASEVLFLDDSEAATARMREPDGNWPAPEIENNQLRNIVPVSSPLLNRGFPYQLRFSNVESYRDPFVWDFEDYESSGAQLYRELSDNAVDKALRQLGIFRPWPPTVSTRSRDDIDPAASLLERELRGGPFTWADVACIAQSGLNRTQSIRSTAGNPDWVWTALGESARLELPLLERDVEPICSEFLNQSVAEGAWTLLDSASFGRVTRWLRDTYASKDLRRFFPPGHLILWLNVQKALHEGVAVDSLYPKRVLETYAPADDNPARSVSFCQKFGYALCVQDAAFEHKDKHLLLQIDCLDQFSPWLGDGCLQFWISKSDLKSGHFRAAFATAEWT